MDYMPDFMEAKYHLAVAKRMLVTYDEYPEKRVLVGVIREGAKASSRLIRSFLIVSGVKGGVDVFSRLVANRYLDEAISENLVKILEVERAQRSSPVEFTRNGKIILLIDGKYRILTVERIREFVNSIELGVERFPTNIKR